MSDADAIHQLVGKINTLTPIVERETTVTSPPPQPTPKPTVGD